MATLWEQILRNILGVDASGDALSPTVGLRSIGTGNGYSSDVAHVYYPPVGPGEVNEWPAVNVIVRDARNTSLAPLAEEHVKTLEFQCFDTEYVERATLADPLRLLADVVKLLQTDPTWGGLVVTTEIVSVGQSPYEQQAPFQVHSVVAEVAYRERRGNPYVQQVIGE